MPDYRIGYAVIISALAVIVTVYDKWAASHRPRHRVPEKTLFLLSVLGGTPAMYLTMLVIRHKTKHKRFMLGLPLILLLQIALLLFLKTRGLW